MQFLNDFYDLWEWFEERMKFKFFLDGVPQMTLRGHDFNRLNDFIANKVKEEGGRFLVEIDKRRKVWVDLSEPFGKEASYPEAQEKLEKVTKDLLLKTSFLPSELTENLNQLAGVVGGMVNVQQMHSANIIKHQKVLDEMLKTLKKIQKGL